MRNNKQRKAARKTFLLLAKHGLSLTPEYRALKTAIKRCAGIYKAKDKRDYFDRGITVYKDWQSPEIGPILFYLHIGGRPSSAHSLDRINNDKGYRPGNVRWATAKQQAANRRTKRIEQFSTKALRKELRRRGKL